MIFISMIMTNDHKKSICVIFTDIIMIVIIKHLYD